MSNSTDRDDAGREPHAAFDAEWAQHRPGPDPATWYCKIGEVSRGLLPYGSDFPMREAITRAYREITGRDPVFLFSGWGAELTEAERRVVDND